MNIYGNRAITLQKAGGAGGTGGEIGANGIAKPMIAFFAVVLAALISMAACMVAAPSAYAATSGATTIADTSTQDAWKLLENSQTNGTKYIGRIWTDKSVTASSATSSSSDFDVTLSALSSMSNTSLTTSSTVPLDIVLVLDVSGSMAQPMDDSAGDEAYEVVSQSDMQENQTYYLRTGSASRGYSYTQLYPYRTSRGTMTWSDVNGNTISSRDTIVKAKESRLDALQKAADDFISKVVESNGTETDASKVHRISIVKYAGNEASTTGNSYYTEYSRWGRVYNNTQVVTDFTAATQDNESTLTNAIDSLTATGATMANYGLALAQEQIGIARVDTDRADSKKIVIYFSDGEPGQNGFTYSTAQSALSYAKNMKATEVGATVYSVGIFDGASSDTPTDSTSNANKFMHGVSSNYPNAQITSSTSWGSTTYTWNLGTRAEGSNYYMTADSTSKLDEVFLKIFDEIKGTSGVPTHITDGFDNSGYITFTDELGAYMKMDGITSITFGTPYDGKDAAATATDHSTTYAWNGKIYDASGAEKTQADVDAATSGTYTYVFQDQEVTPYKDAETKGNLKDIVITVEKRALATGDKVTVKIPASCIPLIQLNVDFAENATTGTYTLTNIDPITVNYGVSLKSGVEALVAEAVAGTGTSQSADVQAMASYIAANTTTDGKIAFYSNKWSGGDDGDATSSFMPATSNSFYYFTEDTPLYTAQDTSKQVTTTTIDENATYYYKHAYYVADAQGNVSEADEADQWVSVPGSYLAAHAESETLVQHNDGYVYIKAGGIRQGWVLSLGDDKAKNETATAKTVIDPSWNYTTTPVSSIENALGNNGLLTLELPATLTVSKTVQAADGFALPSDYASKEFQMTVKIQDGSETQDASVVNGTYKANVLKADGTWSNTSPFDFTFKDGSATQSLKAGETLYIYGLPAGYSYTVTEATPTGGYAEDTGASTGMTGTLAAGAVSAAKIVNTYSAGSATGGSDVLKLTKNYSLVDSVSVDTGGVTYKDDAWGNDGHDNTSFVMHFEAVSFTGVDGTTHTDASSLKAMPTPSGVTGGWQEDDTHPYVSLNATASTRTVDFGQLTFAKPGTYVYDLHEEAGDLSGVSYGGERYRVTFVVSDKGDGTMSVTGTTTEQTNDASGTSMTPTTVTDGSGVVHNLYSTKSIGITLSVNKDYTDNSGGARPLSAGDFSVKVGKATDANGNEFEVTSDVPQLLSGDGTTQNWTLANGIANDADGKFGLGGLWFDTTDAGATYYYPFTEIIPEDAVWSSFYFMKKDGVYYSAIKYRAKVHVENEGGALSATVTYQWYNTFSGTWHDCGEGWKGINNSYSPEKVQLTDEMLSVQKTLAGRDGFEDESYTFTAKLASGPDEGLKNGDDDVLGTGKNISEATISAYDDKGNLVLADGTPVTKALKALDQDPEDGGIYFAKIGTYTFEISETASSSYAGMTNDEHVATVTVKVVDGTGANAGKLVIESITYDNSKATTAADKAVTNAAAFTNAFDQTEDLTGISVTFAKQLTGRAMAAGEFSFTMRPTMNLNESERTGMAGSSVTITQTQATGSAGASATVAVPVDSLSFTGADIGNVFFYTITENIPADAVDANGNTYSSYSTPYGTFTKNGITYDANEYMSLIVEVAYSSEKGLYLIVGDSNDWDWATGTWKEGADTVTSLDGGAVSLADANGNAAFVNEYAESGEGSATPAKVLAGREWATDDVFEFTMVPFTNTAGIARASMPMPDGFAIDATTELPTKTYEVTYGDAIAAAGQGNDTEGVTVGFSTGSITFTQPGTYYYYIQETLGGTTVDGISHDGGTGIVIFEVTRQTDETTGLPTGTLIVSSRVEALQGENTNEFHNDYTLDQTDPYGAEIPWSKVVAGADGPENESFTFTITPDDADEAYVDESGNEVTTSGAITAGTVLNSDGTTITSDEREDLFTVVLAPEDDETSVTEGSHLLSFPSLIFTKAGYYTFDITEAPKPSTVSDEWVYDTHTYKLIIEVYDDGKGKLKAEYLEYEVPDVPVFTNSKGEATSYGAQGGLEVEKTLEGAELEQGQFTYTLVPTTGATSYDKAAAKLDAAYAQTLSTESYDSETHTLTFTNQGADAIGATSAVDCLEGLEFLGSDTASSDVDETFSYTITEVVPDDAVNSAGVRWDEATEAQKAAGGFAKDGVTYDANNVATVEITVRELVAVAIDGGGEERSLYTETKVTKGGVTQTYSSKDGAVAAKVAFTNSYAAEGTLAAGSIAVSKTLSGRDWTDSDAFTFTIAEGEYTAPSGTNYSTPATYPMPSPTSVNVSKPESGATATASFGAITYTQPGTYTYTVTEQDNRTIKTQLSYDTTTYTVTVHVADNGDGTLAATVVHVAETDGANASSGNKTLAFTNSKPVKTAGGDVVNDESGNGSIMAGQTITYTIAFVNTSDTKQNITVSDSIPENTTFVSGSIKATVNGSEVEPGSITLQPSRSNVSLLSAQLVDVPAHATGTVSFSVTVDKSAVQGDRKIVNDNARVQIGTNNPVVANKTETTVDVSEVDYSALAGVQLTNKLTGRDMAQGDYKYTVSDVTVTGGTEADVADRLGLNTAANGYSSPAAGSGETTGVVSLTGNGVIFTQADAGKTYSFTLTETTVQGTSGYTNDTTPRTVTIEVTDDDDNVLTVTTTVKKDGETVATSTVTSNDTASETSKAVTIPFENEYANEPGYLGGRGTTKIEATKTLTGNTLAGDDFDFSVTNTKDEGDKPVASGTNDDSGEIMFSEIEYTTAMLAADYAANLNTRTSTTVDGVTSYTYSYVYKVAETGTLPDGVVAKNGPFNITVDVTDKGDGSALEVAVEYPEGTSSLEFENAYGESASDTVTVSGSKKLVNDVTGSSVTWSGIKDAYTFTLTGVDEDGNAAPLPDETTVAADDSGNVTFGQITYTFENVWGDDAAAADDDGDGADGDGGADDGTGSDTDDGGSDDGTGSDTADDAAADEADAADADASGADASDDAGDENEDSATSGDGVLSAQGDTDGEGVFSAADDAGDVVAADDDVAAAQAVDAADDADDADGAGIDVSSDADDDAESDDADASAGAASAESIGEGRTKTFTYTVSEAGGAAGVTNDSQSSQTFTVTVTDNGDGTLTATPSTTDEKFSFANTYDVKDYDEDGDPIFGISQKILTGRGMALEANEFEFQLTETLADGTVKVISDGWNNAGELDEATGAYTASLTMSAWTYTKDDIGTHTYTFAEVIPEDAATNADGKHVKDGIVYDTTTYTITATVADGGEGELVVTYEIADVAEGEKMAFANNYEPQNVATVELEAGKTLAGRSIVDGEFSFVLKDASGNVVETVANVGNAISFSALEFTEAGEYEYTISEVVPSDATASSSGAKVKDGVTYDETVYKVTITVTDDGKGTLTAVAAYDTEDGAAPVFANTYEDTDDSTSSASKTTSTASTASAASTSTTPDTGDSLAGLWAAVALAIAAVAAIAAGIMYRRRDY